MEENKKKQEIGKSRISENVRNQKKKKQEIGKRSEMEKMEIRKSRKLEKVGNQKT